MLFYALAELLLLLLLFARDSYYDWFFYGDEEEDYCAYYIYNCSCCQVQFKLEIQSISSLSLKIISKQRFLIVKLCLSFLLSLISIAISNAPCTTIGIISVYTYVSNVIAGFEFISIKYGLKSVSIIISHPNNSNVPYFLPINYFPLYIICLKMSFIFCCNSCISSLLLLQFFSRYS